MHAAPPPPLNPLALPEPWDLAAAGYAAEAAVVVEPFSAKAIELAGVSSRSTVVDVAAGSGTLSLLVAPRVAEVYALDFSEAMLAELRRQAAARGLLNIRSQVGDGQALPYADGSFDAGFSMFGLMFFPDRARGFAELRRVLAREGVAVVSSWAPVGDSSLMTAMFGALRAADPAWKEPARDLLSLEAPEQLEREMRFAGFHDVSVHGHAHSVRFPSTQEMWSSMARSSAPLVLMRRRLGEADWAERSEKAAAHLVNEFGPGPLELSTKAWLGIGRT